MLSGVRYILVQVREKYWILRGRQLVKQIVGHCHVCKRLTPKPAQQTIAPLPRDRVTEAPPFEITGVDFAGPLYVKSNETSKKAYIALFTHAVTRAVHLELVSDQIHREIPSRSEKIYSKKRSVQSNILDNIQRNKTFKRADQDLKELWMSFKISELTDFFSLRFITWKFIVERAAWWGGFLERLVRSVKNCLKKEKPH